MTVSPALVRLLWFVGYWLAGVAVVLAIAAGLKVWLVSA